MPDALSKLLSLPREDKESKGLVYTPQEIHHQPETWRGTLEELKEQHGRILDFLEGAGIRPDAANRPTVLLIGAGTSDYAGRALTRLLRQQWQCEVMAVPSTELVTNMEDFILPGKDYLWISFSRSGDSSEGVAVIEQALERYPSCIRHLIVTCNRSGAMALRFTHHSQVGSIILNDSVNDRGLAMTSSFTNMVIAGQYLAYIHTPRRYEPLLESLARMGERLLPHAANLAAALAQLPVRQVCFLGSGALQAVADESALKVLELNAGRIHNIAQSPLGLRHGPFSAVDAATLVVCYLSGSEKRAQYEMDLLEEMRAKQLGSRMVIVTPTAYSRLTSLNPDILTLEAPQDFPDACRPPVDVIAGQLLGLFFSVKNGITPDSPSASGTISRVVSHVKIYSQDTTVSADKSPS